MNDNENLHKTIGYDDKVMMLVTLLAYITQTLDDSGINYVPSSMAGSHTMHPSVEC